MVDPPTLFMNLDPLSLNEYVWGVLHVFSAPQLPVEHTNIQPHGSMVVSGSPKRW